MMAKEKRKTPAHFTQCPLSMMNKNPPVDGVMHIHTTTLKQEMTGRENRRHLHVTFNANFNAKFFRLSTMCELLRWPLSTFAFPSLAYMQWNRTPKNVRFEQPGWIFLSSDCVLASKSVFLVQTGTFLCFQAECFPGNVFFGVWCYGPMTQTTAPTALTLVSVCLEKMKPYSLELALCLLNSSANPSSSAEVDELEMSRASSLSPRITGGTGDARCPEHGDDLNRALGPGSRETHTYTHTFKKDEHACFETKNN